MSRARRIRWMPWLLAVAALVLAGAAMLVWINVRGEAPLDSHPALPLSPGLVDKGAYLARAGNCMGCHTTAGGAEFAGGMGVHTPFGTVFAPNITPDGNSGIGHWTAAEFWRAMHHGRSKDGRLLYPAFPYPSYTKLTREDSDALFAYLRSVKPVAATNKPHELRFPYSTQAALAIWRALYFKPGEFAPEPRQTAGWNRGKYLVDGLAHCAACHSPRNGMGGASLNAEFAGGLMPDEAWYAPSLASPHEAGVQAWPRDEVVKLLKHGTSAQASVSGPMADVVFSSTQHLDEQDLGAMAAYLASIPVREPVAPPAERATSGALGLGAKVYEQHCAACHGDQGQGVPAIYPALAGNRAVLLASPHNVVQIIRHGGFAPSTVGNPQPFGMPPFMHLLGNEEIAAVASFVRQSWGNAAPAVSTLDVHRVR